MIKKILSVVLSVALITCFIPTLSFAESEPVAEDEQIGTQSVGTISNETILNTNDSTNIISTQTCSLGDTIVASGSCGENAFWEIDEKGTLLITGRGELGGDHFQAPWYNQKDLITNIYIDEGITNIPGDAFSLCKNLVFISIPSSIKYWGGGNNQCKSLKKIKYEGTIEDYCKIQFSGYLFGNEYDLYISGRIVNDLIIPSGIKSISDYAFCNCKSISSVIVPEGVNTIGKYAFSDCKNLTSIDIADSVEELGDGFVYYDSNLINVKLPSSIKKIPDGAFNGCVNINSIDIPENVSEIGRMAFYRCERLTEIDIPDTVNTIGRWAFWDCKSLKEINIPNGVKDIGESTFYGCSSLSKVNLPNNLETIGEQAFEGCKSLKIIDIPTTVTIVSKRAFCLCGGLEEVNIPSSVSYIGDYAFSGCISVILNSQPLDEITKGLWGIKNEIKYPCSKWTEQDRDFWNAEITWTEIHRKGIINEIVLPTCLEEGYTEYICSECGKPFKEDLVRALGHDYHTTIITSAGLLRNGKQCERCYRCGDSKNEQIIKGYSTLYLKSFKVTKGERRFTAKWSKQSAKNQKKFNGYQIRYSLNKNMSSAKTTTAKRSSSSKTIKSLKAKKYYYVQVRTYTKKNGTTFYSKWSTTKAVKTK